MLLEDAIHTFITHMKVRNYAYQTIIHYQCILRYLRNWMLTNGYPNPTIHDLTNPLLRRFMQYLSEARQRPRTIKGKFAAIDTLCRYLVEENLLPANPNDNIKMPKMDVAKRELITDDQITLLMDACDRIKGDRKRAMCRAVLCTFVHAGLRRAECRDLLFEDVNVDDKSIYVRSGKGSKSRTIYLPPSAVEHFREWKAQRGKCNHNYLFGTSGRRLHDTGIAHLMADIARLAGLEGNEAAKPHSIRHAFATRLLRGGADLVTISKLLGHTGENAIRTTQIYLSTNEDQLRAAAEKAELPKQPKTQEPQRSEAPSSQPPSPESPHRKKTSPRTSVWRNQLLERN